MYLNVTDGERGIETYLPACFQLKIRFKSGKEHAFTKDINVSEPGAGMSIVLSSEPY